MIYERDSPEDPERDTQQSFSPLQQRPEPNPAPSGLTIRALRPANIHHADKQCVKEREETQENRHRSFPGLILMRNNETHRGTFKQTMFGELIESQSLV